MKKKTPVQAKIQQPAWLDGNRPLFILLGISFLIYLPALKFGFSPLDERWLIVGQQKLLGSFGNVPELFKSAVLGMYYRPVCMASFMIDNITGNGSTLVFHFTNILLHSISTVLLYRFLTRLKIDAGFAFFAALIFVVHPINVHTVAWIPGRNDSLLCLFSILSCLQLLSWMVHGKIHHFLIHLLAFSLALLTKENAIVLPFVYALLWYFFAKEKNKSSAIFLVSCWLSMSVLWFMLRGHIVDRLPPVSSAMSGTTILNFFSSLFVYSGKTILPFDQSIMPDLNDMSVLPFIIASFVLILLSFKPGLRDKKTAVFGAAWFFIFLIIPAWAGTTSNNGEQYEHRIYTSMAGAFIFFSQFKINFSPVVLKRLAILLTIAFSIKTIARSQVYKDDFSFLEAATAESPSIAFFQNNFGFLYEQKMQYRMAMNYYNEAIRLDSGRAEYYNNRANLFFKLKDYKHAFEDDNKSLSLKKNQAPVYINRSMAAYFLGNHKEAVNDLATGQKGGAEPSDEYMNVLYNALQLDTIKMCSEKLELDSNDVHILNQRGICNLRLKLYKAALNDFDHALRIRPASKAIQYNRNLALTNLKYAKPGN